VVLRQESGATLKRPEFDRLQADIFDGKVKTVVLWMLDRLSRRLKDGITTLIDWSEKNLRIVVVTQRLDFNGSVGRMIAALLLGLAETENEYRKERQAAGIEQTKKKGKDKGRAYGTLKGNPGRVAELREKGPTPRRPARRCRANAPSTGPKRKFIASVRGVLWCGVAKVRG
jgi:DNA invertase Pin-like site-specific DNA recombinase